MKAINLSELYQKFLEINNSLINPKLSLVSKCSCIIIFDDFRAIYDFTINGEIRVELSLIKKNNNFYDIQLFTYSLFENNLLEIINDLNIRNNE